MAAFKHYKDIFTGECKIINEENMECIARIINHEQNSRLTSIPDIDELKNVIFSMNPNSAVFPDVMKGYFFKKCWQIIKTNLMGLLNTFLSSQMIPKYYSHSWIVLLPKVNNLSKLTEIRAISLSNFTRKIISNLLCNRLRPILPSLISPNQSGIVKGRSIF